MSESDFELRDNLFFPDSVSRLTIQELTKWRDLQGTEIMSGLGNIDKIITPFRGGELIPVLGYTNNFKSGFMSVLARNASKQLTKENEIIIVCNWEESVEDKGIWDLAEMAELDTTALDRGEFTDSEWKKILDASIKRADVPIYYIGHSDQDLRRRPRLNLEQVWSIFEHLYDYHGKVARMVVLDYLQRIRPIVYRRDWRISMMETVDLAKDMSIAFKCPVLLGTQAGRKVRDLADPKMPMLEHAQETSNIEQSASKFFSVCLPIKTMEYEETVNYAGNIFTVRNDLLFVALLKQKRGPAPAYFAFSIDYKTHRLTPYSKEGVKMYYQYDLEDFSR